ncbi:uncharacterized protein LOC119696544 [Motacilla alba alba]|uniref:uncharacterized protein LOC119696544 n=1 Tax=Motacilla alba alba TaxID=1094192 RepID=UPI0018D56281|nr:uncharacterized protein LOC119696544 [Motacilla alba alba]
MEPKPAGMEPKPAGIQPENLPTPAWRFPWIGAVQVRGGAVTSPPRPFPAAPDPARAFPRAPRPGPVLGRERRRARGSFGTGAAPERPQSGPAGSPVSMEDQEVRPDPAGSPVSMEDQELLKRLVAVVATLGTVVAAVTGQHRDVRRRLSPNFLHAALGRFTQSLRETLDHGDVTSLGHRGVISLGQALAAFEATPEAWDNVRAAAEAWRKLVATLMGSWEKLAKEATKLCDACEHMAPTRAREPQDEAPHRGTAGDNLAATARWPPVALDREEVATHDAQEAMATDEEEAAMSEEELAMSEEELAMSEEELAISEEEPAISEEELAVIEEELAMSEEELASKLALTEEEAAMGREEVATNEPMGEAMVATRKGHWAEAALEPLKRLVAACDRATLFLQELQWLLKEFEADVEWACTDEEFPSVPEALVDEAAEFEQLWDGSARLAEGHLLRILELIDNLLLNPYAGPGGPGGPGSRAVDERCQEAIKAIPRLLRGQ